MRVNHDQALYEECPNKAAERQRWDRTLGASVTVPLVHDVAPSQASVSCWWCRSRRQRLRGAHRKRPPLPPAPGVCQLCLGELTGRRRSWCSDGCVEVWMGAAAGPIMVRHLVALHGRACFACGASDPWMAVEVDHVRPLWSLTDEERTEPRWWLPYNVQLLCVPCHKAKTAREAADRAAGRPPRPAAGEQLALA